MPSPPNPITTPYGLWKSPITAADVVAGSLRLGEISSDAGAVYWVESRRSEGGRSVLVRARLQTSGNGAARFGAPEDVTPAPFNVRTRVHEYGGASYLANGDTVYFSSFTDCRLYRQQLGGEPVPVTPDEKLRYADFAWDSERSRIICVVEDHRIADTEPENLLGTIDPASGSVTPLVRGADFYSNPRISPDGASLAWIQWNHPNMPWDGARLWVGELGSGGEVGQKVLVAGSDSESVGQPLWTASGDLLFISDRTGWWNLYSWSRGAARPLWPKDAEFGVPQWVFGLSSNAVLPNGDIVCSYVDNGVSRLAVLASDGASPRIVETGFSVISAVCVAGEQVVLVASSHSAPPSVVALHLPSWAPEVLRKSSSVSIPAAFLSEPEPVAFESSQGLAYGLFYPPKNDNCRAPEGALAPLVVSCHGGPTSASTAALNPMVQFWTSRGFAYVDVNYSGSTGYGRSYRDRLKSNWGVVDVEDCTNAALWLAANRGIDPTKMAIRGGSAGGYTALAAVAQGDTFSAAASYYGVSDLELLASDTHKFESRYLDNLVGPYPEQNELYRQRSPVRHAERIHTPVIFFQGADDHVVPPNQAQVMVDALKANHIPVAFVLFEGEGHGFRRADSQLVALESELYFYLRIFSLLEPADNPPVEIANL